jgi:CheY-like chemotaxis protein
MSSHDHYYHTYDTVVTNQRLFKRMLQGVADVTIANDGSEALTAWSEAMLPFDIIFTDIHSK